LKSKPCTLLNPTGELLPERLDRHVNAAGSAGEFLKRGNSE
jgi:hypothetical protein